MNLKNLLSTARNGGATMNDIICGASAAIATFAVTAENGTNLWTSILAALVSALIFGAINIGTKVITSVLEKKGLISSENKKDIDSIADDLSDDGQINKSNKDKK